MANPDETFDPNDLESIDALLDEAELEAVSDDLDVDQESPESAEIEQDFEQIDDGDNEEPPTDPSPEIDTDQAEASEPAEQADDDIMDSLDELVSEAEGENTSETIDKLQEDLESDPEPEVVGVADPLDKVIEPVQENKKSAVEVNNDVDDFLEKRAAAQSTQKANISVDDMDSIKKLIIIFGSVLSVLLLTAIGIGVWSALAASSAGVDDDTKQLIESIKVATDTNGAAIGSSEKTTKSVEKKLDAINFQIEQLAADIAALESGKANKEEMIDPLGLGAPKDKQGSDKKPVVQTAMMAPVAASPEMMKKISAVSSRLYKAHKRIDEINKRVKTLQSQSSTLMQSVKLIEKEALIVQTERVSKQKEMEAKAKKAEQNPYRYSAPDGGFYDESVSDSYP